MDIIKATTSDIPAIQDIMKRGIWSNQALYRLQVLNDQIMHLTPEYVENLISKNHYYIGRIDDTIVAVGGVSIDKRPADRSIINSLFVHPDYHGKGYGKQMLEFLLTDEWVISRRFVDVASSYSAVSFYASYGFEAKPDETKAHSVMMTKPVG